MHSTIARTEQPTILDAIAGDRRSDRRYNLELELRWKLIRRRRVLDSGVGRTIDLSSGGILFESGRHMPPGLNVELSITWPVRLHDMAPMQLFVYGRIVRAQKGSAAIRMVQHEFRTAGIPAEHLLVPPSRMPSAFLSGFREVPVLAKAR
jgi:hypothetical protein